MPTPNTRSGVVLATFFDYIQIKLKNMEAMRRKKCDGEEGKWERFKESEAGKKQKNLQSDRV